MENPSKNPNKGFLRRRLTKIISWITGLSLGASFLLILLGLAGLAIFVRTETFQNGLRDRILQAARADLGTQISYETAKVSIFQLEPTIEFTKVKLFHDASQATADIDRIAVGISVFTSLPALFFRELHLTSAELEGLQYSLSSTKTIEKLLQSVRPKKSYLPSSFQTSIDTLRLSRIQVALDLDKNDILKRRTTGKLTINQVELNLRPDQTLFTGNLSFDDLVVGTRGPYSGVIALQNGSHNDTRTRFQRVTLERGNDTFELSGEIKNWQDPIIDIKGHFDFALEEYLLSDALAGRAISDFSFKGPAKDPQGDGNLILKNLIVAGRKFDELAGRWRLKYPGLEVKDLRWSDKNEKIALRGNISLDPRAISNLQIDFDQLNLGSYLGWAAPDLEKWKGATSGSLKYEGKLAEFRGDVGFNLKISDYRIRSRMHETEILKVSDLKIEGSANLDGISTGQFNASVTVGDSRSTGTAKWTSEQFDLMWDSSFQGSKFGDLFSRPVELSGSMKGSLRGPWRDLVMSVDQNLRFFRLEHQEVNGLKGQLILKNRVLFGAPLIANQLSLTGGIYFSKSKEDEFSNFRFEGKGLDAQFLLSLFHLNTETTKNLHGDMKLQGFLKGPLTAPIGSGTLQLDAWNFGDSRVRGRQAKFKWATASGETFFDGLEVKASPDSEPLRGELSFDKDGLVDLALEGRKVRLQDWLYLMGQDLGIQSLADLDFDFQRGTPSLKARLRLFETSLSGSSQPDSLIDLLWTKDLVTTSGGVFGTALEFKGSLKQDAKDRQANVRLKFNEFNLLASLKAFKNSRIELPITGDGQLSMTQVGGRDELLLPAFLFNAKTYQGRVDVQQASIRRGKAILQQIDGFPIRLSATDQGTLRWSFDQMKINSQDRALMVRGSFDSSKKYSINLRGGTDLRLLAFMVDSLSRSEGLVDIDGVFDQDGFTGRLDLSEGLLTFANSPIVVRNVEATLKGQGELFDLTRLKGDFKEGAITGSGRVRLSGTKLDSAQLNFKLDGTVIQPQTGVSFRVSGPLNLQLQNEDGQIDGRLQISEGLYRKRIDLQGDVFSFFTKERKEVRSFTEETATLPLKLNIILETSEPFNIRNNIAEGAATFNLVAKGTLKEPHLTGSMNLIRGQFKYTNRDFELRSGSIQFVDTVSNVPNYDIRADSEIGDYRVNVRLLGGPTEQKIIYTSDPPLNEKDILSLIQVGIPASAPELQGQGSSRSTSLTGISFVTGQIQGRIEDKLQTDLGIRRLYLLPAFHERTGQPELQLTVGMDVVKDKLEANYSTFVTGPGGQKVELDYKVNRFVSVVGSWRDTEKGVDDFGGDLRFRFEFE